MVVISTSNPFRGLVLLAVALLLLVRGAAAQAPAWQWGLQTANPTPTDGSSARGYSVATDAAGRVYVGGALNESGTPGRIARNFGSAGQVGGSRTGFIAQATAAGQWAWAVAAQPSGSSAVPPGASVNGLAVTPAGDVYAVGLVVGGGLTIGSQTRTLATSNNALFVARLNSAGVCLALEVVEGTFQWPAVALDPSTGGVVVVGSYRGAPAFGPITLPTVGPGNSAGPVFVARLGATGQWQGAAASTGSTGIITAPAVAVGPAGQVAVASSQGAGTLTFGATTLTVPTGIDQSYVVAQLSALNQWQWAVGGGTSPSGGWAIGTAYTPAGALWVSGRGPNGTVLGATTLTAPGSGTGAAASVAGFLGQLSATGQWTRVQQFAPSASGLAVCGPLTVDGTGTPYFMGGFLGYNGPVQAMLGTQTLATTTAVPLLLFVARLGSAGQWQYVATVPAPAIGNALNPQSIALDASGSLYFTGDFRGSLVLGSSALSGSYNPTAQYPENGDVVLGKLINATTLSARSATAAPALACFPNPARTATTVARPAGITGPVTLLDALGRPVRTYPVAAPAAVLDLSGLAPGFYVVRCGGASGRLVVE